MNVSTKQQQSDQGIYNFIKQVLPIADVAQTGEHSDNMVTDDQQRQRSLAYAKQVLDCYFPLTHGSHQQVSSYVVYYNQLLAFFDDGAQTGLAQSRQLVALTGQRCSPSSVVLKNNGFHLEILFDDNGDYGRHDSAAVNDVQLETRLLTIAQPTHEFSQRKPNSWTSLITGGSSRENKQFTAKDGSDYHL